MISHGRHLADVDANQPFALACATCGRPLLGTDPEDEPDGDAGCPICGECNRERNFAAIEEVEQYDQDV